MISKINKIRKTAVVSLALIASFIVSPTASAFFQKDLSLGDNNQDVKQLQVFLNNDSRTKLTSNGPGSPGQETSYFGPLTKGAVIRFQELYRNEVLDPVGLYYGSGYFGPSSRAKVNLLYNNTSRDTSKESTYEAYNTSNTPQPEDSNEGDDTNYTHPNNLVGLDKFIEKHRDLARQEGWSQYEIETSVERIRETVATSTDLKARFAKDMRESMGQVSTLEEAIEKAREFLDQVEQSVADSEEFKDYEVFRRVRPSPFASLNTVEPSPLAAVTGVIEDMGGFLVYTYPCTCGFVVWQLLIIEPYRTQFKYVDYVIGTQMKSTYTLPYASQVVGQYLPQTASVICYQYAGTGCVGPIPSMGIVNPTNTGSSI